MNKHICFYCDTEFTKSESLANNTHEQYATTYCSRVCEDKDLEEMAKHSEVKPSEAVETKTVGGFTLKIKKENPNE